MGSSIWQGGVVSVILLPSGEQGETLFDLAAQWTSLALLGRALWVRPERVDLQENQPPKIQATVLGLDALGDLQQIDVDLFEALARESLSLVRLVKVRSALPDREQDQLQDAIAGPVAEYVTLSMPSANPSYSHVKARTELLKVSLICAPSEFQLRERVQWAQDEQGVTMVASPEDRTNPWAGDAFVRDNERFPGFSLMHIATIAGLWNGLPTGTLELFEREASSASSIWMPRVFMKGVMTDGLARRLAASVLDQAADATSALMDPNRGVPAAGTSVIPDERVDDYVRAMVDSSFLLDDAKLSYKRPALGAELPKDRVRSMRQLGMFLIFMFDKLRSMPHWALVGIRAGFTRLLTRNLHGKEGRSTVVSGDEESVDSRDQMLLRERENVVRAQAAAKDTLNAPASASSVRSTPRLWTGLRELVFGALDGSADLADRGFSQIEDKIPVFGRVSDVVQDPSDSWDYPGVIPEGLPATIGWSNMQEGPAVRAKLRAIIAEKQAVIDAIESKCADVDRRLDQDSAKISELQTHLLKSQVIEIGENGAIEFTLPDADPESEAQAAVLAQLDEFVQFRAGLKDLEKQRANLQAELDRAVHERDSFRMVLDSFELWFAKHERSYLWQVLLKMNGVLENAHSELATLEARAAALRLPEPGTLVSLRKKFNRRVGWTAVASAIVGYLAMWWGRNSEAGRNWENYPNDWTIAIAAVVAILVLTVIYAIIYYRGWSEFERGIARSLYDLYRLSDGVKAARGEIQRLESQQRQTTDWFELLAISLYTPWQVNPAWLESGLHDLDNATLPFAMQIAHTFEDDSAASVRLKESTAQSFVRAGWRAEAFEELLDSIGENLGLNAGNFGLDALDHDLPHASNNSRRIVRQNMSDSSVLESVARRRLKVLIAEVQSGALYESRQSVRRVITDPLAVLQTGDVDGIQIGDSAIGTQDLDWSSFLTGALGTESDPISPLSVLGIAPYELQGAHHQNVTSFVMMPRRIHRQVESFLDESMRVTPYDDDTARQLDLVLRIDMVGPIPPKAVHLWGDVPRRTTRFTPDTSDELRCAKCGRPNCPAADPASSLLCANSGI